MYDPLLATCDDTSCDNNRNRVETLVCSGCGHCAACALHSSCETTHRLRGAKVAVCGSTSCLNNTNQVVVVVCAYCGQCADCSLHDHG